jgi:hypothetical protein
MATKTLLRRSIGLALGLSLATTTGCAVVGAVADRLADEGPPGVTRPQSERALAGVGLGDAAVRGATSGYLASPALTWGALQLQRPHAITGSIFDRPDIGRPGCRAASSLFVITQVPEATPAEDLARGGPLWLGSGDSVVRIGTAFSPDREVMADRAMRSGAFLVQRGPVCAQSLFFAFRWTIGGDDDAVAVHW